MVATARLSYSLGAAQHATDGFQPFNSRFRQGVGSALLGASLARSTRASPRDTPIASSTSRRTARGEVVDSNAVRRDDRLAVGLDAGYRVSRCRHGSRALASHDVHGVTDDQPDSPGDDGYAYTTAERSRRRSGDVRVELALPADSRLTLGTQVERKWQESVTRSNFGDDAPAPATRRSTGGYAQLLLAPVADATVVLGGRLEHNEQFGDFWTYRAAASTRACRAAPGFVPASAPRSASRPSSRLTAAASSSATAPSTPSTRSASTPASSSTFGPAIHRRHLVRELLPRHDRLPVLRDGAELLQRRAHARRGSRAGGSARAAERIPRRRRVHAISSTRVVDPGTSPAATATFAPGSRLLRRPARTLDVGAGYRAAGHAVDLRALRVGTREDVYYPPDFAPRSASPSRRTPASTFPARRASRRCARRGGVTLTLRVENLFDRRYTDAAGFNYDFARTDEASIQQTGYRGAARRLLTGLRVSF